MIEVSFSGYWSSLSIKLTLRNTNFAITGHNKPTSIANNMKNVPHPNTQYFFDCGWHRKHILLKIDDFLCGGNVHIDYLIVVVELLQEILSSSVIIYEVNSGFEILAMPCLHCKLIRNSQQMKCTNKISHSMHKLKYWP